MSERDTARRKGGRPSKGARHFFTLPVHRDLADQWDAAARAAGLSSSEWSAQLALASYRAGLFDGIPAPARLGDELALEDRQPLAPPELPDKAHRHQFRLAAPVAQAEAYMRAADECGWHYGRYLAVLCTNGWAAGLLRPQGSHEELPISA